MHRCIDEGIGINWHMQAGIGEEAVAKNIETTISPEDDLSLTQILPKELSNPPGMLDLPIEVTQKMEYISESAQRILDHQSSRSALSVE